MVSEVCGTRYKLFGAVIGSKSEKLVEVFNFNRKSYSNLAVKTNGFSVGFTAKLL